MALTPEDIIKLEMPLPLEDHEARAKGKNKKGDKQQWLIYITQEGVIPLLNSIDPSWTWEVREASKWDKYAVVTGRLTIKDVYRDGRGGNSPNSAGGSTDEDTEKGAETDALKRAAVKFGVGLYLRSAPVIWLPYAETNKPWEDEAAALKEFENWYKRTFGAQQGGQNARKAPPAPVTTNAPKAGDTGAKFSGESTPVGTKTSDDFAKEFPANKPATPDALYDVTHDYFNARKHFDNFWAKHAEMMGNLTLEEATAFVKQAHWNWDKEQATKLVNIGKEVYGMTVKDVMDALTDGGQHSIKTFRDWDGGNFTVAQGALLAWVSKYDPTIIRDNGEGMGVAQGVIDAALDIRQLESIGAK